MPLGATAEFDHSRQSQRPHVAGHRARRPRDNSDAVMHHGHRRQAPRSQFVLPPARPKPGAPRDENRSSEQTVDPHREHGHRRAEAQRNRPSLVSDDHRSNHHKPPMMRRIVRANHTRHAIDRTANKVGTAETMPAERNRADPTASEHFSGIAEHQPKPSLGTRRPESRLRLTSCAEFPKETCARSRAIERSQPWANRHTNPASHDASASTDGNHVSRRWFAIQ